MHDLGRSNISINKIELRLQEIEDALTIYKPLIEAPQIMLDMSHGVLTTSEVYVACEVHEDHDPL